MMNVCQIWLRWCLHVRYYYILKQNRLFDWKRNLHWRWNESSFSKDYLSLSKNGMTTSNCAIQICCCFHNTAFLWNLLKLSNSGTLCDNASKSKIVVLRKSNVRSRWGEIKQNDIDITVRLWARYWTIEKFNFPLLVVRELQSKVKLKREEIRYVECFWM